MVLLTIRDPTDLTLINTVTFDLPTIYLQPTLSFGQKGGP